MGMKIKNTDTAVRILFEKDIDVSVFKENILQKDGSLFTFKMDLAGCKTEQDVINLIERYV